MKRFEYRIVPGDNLAFSLSLQWDVYRFPIPEPPYSKRTRLATFAYKAHATRFVRMLKGKVAA